MTSTAITNTKPALQPAFSLTKGAAMKLKATDSFHTSGLGSVHAGQEFEVHDALGREIANKGLATVIEESTDTSAGADSTEVATPKSLPEADAKMVEAPENKLISAPLNKRGPGRPPKSKAEPEPDATGDDAT